MRLPGESQLLFFSLSLKKKKEEEGKEAESSPRGAGFSTRVPA